MSFLLFTISLSLWGVSQIPFYIVYQKFFIKNKRKKILSYIGAVFGIFTGFFFICIAFTPSDINGFCHNFFVLLGFGSVFISLCMFTILIFQNNDYPNFYAIIYAITSGIWVIFYLALFFIPKGDTSNVLFIYVSGQKIVIYALLICGIYQGYGALKQLHS
jgi:Na+/proline symporter